MPTKTTKIKSELPPKTNRELVGALLLDAVMSSPIMGSREKTIYKIIFEHGPISAAEAEKISGIRGVWATVSALRARKMITEGEESAHTDTGRKAKTWVISGNPPAENPFTHNPAFRSRNHYTGDHPTKHELQVFSREVAVLFALANDKGARISLITRKVQKWLADGAPCHTCHSRKKPSETK